jgi:hypothetical protein
MLSPEFFTLDLAHLKVCLFGMEKKSRMPREETRP